MLDEDQQERVRRIFEEVTQREISSQKIQLHTDLELLDQITRVNRQDLEEPEQTYPSDRIEEEIPRRKTSPFKARNFLGLDIGSQSVKFVEVRRRKGKPVIVDYGIHRFSSQPGVMPTAEERREALQEVVKQILKKNPRRVLTSLSGPDVSVRYLTLPKMPRKELKEALLWASRKEVPFAEEEIVLDFKILGERVEDNVSKLEILVVVAKKELVQTHLSLMKELGVTPTKLVVLPLALWNLLLEAQLKGCVLMIDLGAENTTMAFFNEGKLLFVREITTAGNAITEAISGTIFYEDGQVNLSPSEAERLKLTYGFPEDSSHLKTEQGVPLSEISVMMRPVLERLLNEIQRSLEYFKEKFSLRRIDRIYLSGGTARLKNLSRYLSQNLGVETQVFDPSVHFQSEVVGELSPQLAGALGLALDQGKELNLLPEELKRIPRLRLRRRILAYAALMVLLLLAILTVLGFLQSYNLTRQLRRLKAEYERVTPIRERYLNLKRQVQYLKKKKQIYSSQIRSSSDACLVLKALSHLVPKEIVLTSLTFSKKSFSSGKKKVEGKLLRLNGIVLGEEEARGVILAEFMMGLEKSGYFSSVALTQNPSFTPPEGMPFELVCRFNPPEVGRAEAKKQI